MIKYARKIQVSFMAKYKAGEGISEVQIDWL